MWPRRVIRLLLTTALALLVGACGPFTADQEEPLDVSAVRSGITLPLSVYIVDDVDGELSSTRTETEVESIVAHANEIWEPAGIRFELVERTRVDAPNEVLRSLAAGDVDAFVRSLGRGTPVPNPSMLNAFYVSSIGGPNGIAPIATRVVLVMDTPSVDDERVTAHELGHRLGLHHTTTDTGRLLFPGANGRALSDEEIAVARYAAQGLLDGVRTP